MLGAGTVINPIIKIVTTVAILAAVYFFIVKPTLDTTERRVVRAAVTDSFEGFDGLPATSRSQVEDAVRRSTRAGRSRHASSELHRAARSTATSVELRTTLHALRRATLRAASGLR